jgi:hypothetical protein
MGLLRVAFGYVWFVARSVHGWVRKFAVAVLVVTAAISNMDTTVQVVSFLWPKVRDAVGWAIHPLIQLFLLMSRLLLHGHASAPLAMLQHAAPFLR